MSSYLHPTRLQKVWRLEEIYIQVCPEIFETKGDNAIAEMVEVTEDLKEYAKEAADSCPSEAIIIEQ